MVSDETDLVFTSNRGEKSVGIFRHGQEEDLERVTVGGYPNGLAFDPRHHRLIAANVPKPNDSSLVTCSVVDTASRNLIADIIVPGRTRWTIFDEKSGRFYVNIAKPSKIVAIDSSDPDGIVASYDIPGVGPHGLDLDLAGRRLFCACDDGQLYTVEPVTGRVVRAAGLSGAPDVIFHNAKKKHLYVAIGDPGVVDVIDTENLILLQTVTTELGAHTIAYDPELSKVYAFLPGSHRASVYLDT